MIRLIDAAIDVYIWLVIIRVVLSWFQVNPFNPFVQFLIRVTEPVLGRIRQVLPDFGGLDLSPVVLILGLYVLRSLLIGV